MLAAAAVQVFPGTLLVEGGDHLSGFYYDFIFPFKFRKEFLSLIEEKMRQLIKAGHPIKLVEMVPENGAAYLNHLKQPIRAERILEEEGGLAQLFQIDSFIDHCQGSFLKNTDEIKAFRLHEMSELEEDLVRIWGVSFFTPKELKDHFRAGSAKKIARDHIQLGTEMDLFSAHETGEGKQWRWHPKGESVRDALITYWKEEHQKEQFHFFHTPRSGSFSKEELTKIHFDYLLSKKEAEFPYKLSECGYFKDEDQKKSYCGLLDTKNYFADLSHIFCMEETLEEEVISSLQFMRKFSTLFTLERKWILWASPIEKKASPLWERQLGILKKALMDVGIEFTLDKGRGLKDGPELHLLVKDGMGRWWTISTMKLECALTQKMGYQGFLIVRSLFSSLERWIALILEQDQGKFPLKIEEALRKQVSYASIVGKRSQKKEAELESK